MKVPLVIADFWTSCSTSGVGKSQGENIHLITSSDTPLYDFDP